MAQTLQTIKLSRKEKEKLKDWLTVDHTIIIAQKVGCSRSSVIAAFNNVNTLSAKTETEIIKEAFSVLRNSAKEQLDFIARKIVG